MAGSYFIKRGEKVIGPMSPDALKDRIGDGKIRETDHVAKASSGPWKIIGDIPALASLFESDDDPFDVYGDDEYGDDAYGDDSYDTPPLPPSMPAKKIRVKKTRETQDYGNTSTVPCRVCGKRVAKEAKTCPKCGVDWPCKNEKRGRIRTMRFCALLIATGSALWFASQFYESESQRWEGISKSAVSSGDTEGAVEAIRESERLAKVSEALFGGSLIGWIAGGSGALAAATMRSS